MHFHNSSSDLCNYSFNVLTLCLMGNFSYFYYRLRPFSKSTCSKKCFDEQKVWIQIRLDILFVMIWVQTICKGYQQLSADFFQNQIFQKLLSGTLSEYQMVWIQNRTNILSVLISVKLFVKLISR